MTRRLPRALIALFFLLLLGLLALPGCGDGPTDASPADLSATVDTEPTPQDTAAPSAAAARATATRQPLADPPQTYTIIVEDVQTAAQQTQVQQELTRIAQGKPVAPVGYQNRVARFTVGLIEDPAAFANLITFGQVRAIDKAARTITIRYNQ